MLWVTRKTALVGMVFLNHNSSNSLRRFSAVSTSSAEKGSSMKSTSGSTTRARAKPTRCFMPPESSFGYAPSKPSSPTVSNMRRLRSRRSAAGTPRACGGCGETGEHAQHGGLAGAGGTEQGEDLAGNNTEIGGRDDLDAVLAGLGVVFLDFFGADDRAGIGSRARRLVGGRRFLHAWFSACWFLACRFLACWFLFLKSVLGAKQMRGRLRGFTAGDEELQILRDCSIPI